jgi:penicillin amidase
MFSELRGVVGSDMNKWTWGKIHSLTFEHVLGKKRFLARIFNLGPFQVGGSHLTVNKGRYPYGESYRVDVGVSERMIVDLSNIGGSLHVLPTGESGNLKSPHYKDQIGFYLGGGYHNAWMDRREVEKNSEATLILKPKF